MTIGDGEFSPAGPAGLLRADASAHGPGMDAKAAAGPEIRQDRVAALRKKIQSGEYQVSDRQLADAIYKQLFEKGSENLPRE